MKVFVGKRIIVLLSIMFLFTACSTSTDIPPTKISSTQQKDAAPYIKKDVSLIPDAIPQPVQRTRAGNKSPYTVFGETYSLLADSQGYQEVGGASWYGTKFHGRRTSNGEVYDMWGMTAAHKTLPIPSYVRVTNLDNGKSVVVRVNDRGPFHSARIIDLSYGAATKLGFAKKGVAQVEVVDVTPTVVASPSPLAPVVTSPSTAANAQPSPVKPKLVIKPTSPVAKQSPEAAVEKPMKRTYLQVAAFKAEGKATQLKNTLSSLLSTNVKAVPSSDGRWFRVRVGPVDNSAQMSEARQILSEQGFKSPQVIQR